MTEEGGQTKIHWGHASRDDECWYGNFATRDEAIAAGKELYEGNFYICSGTSPDPAEFLPSTDFLLESMRDHAADQVGEVPEDWPAVTAEAEAELTELLSAWARKHAPCDFWVVDDAVELIAWGET